jgi:CheY-like chemotaxis protein
MEHTTLAGFSILVVARDPAARHFHRALEGAGARVFVASEGNQALRTIEQTELSGAVLDIDGSAQSRAVARRLVELGIPFVACAEARESLSGLASSVLERPIIDAELIEVLGGLLRCPLETAAGRRGDAARTARRSGGLLPAVAAKPVMLSA